MNADANLIKVIDFELSSICNAVCPVCIRRNKNGYLEKFEQTYWKFEDVRRTIDIDIIKNLEMLSICGNYGDAMGNPDIVKIIKWFRIYNENCLIYLRTNGGIGTKAQYKQLAKLDVHIVFGIDGFGKGNNLYRVNTNWNKIDQNLKEFSNNAKSYQTEIQFLLWNETIDQLLPMIDYLENINFNTLYLRKPYTRGEYTEVFDIHERSTHFLSELKNTLLDFIVETKWSKNKLKELKNKIILANITATELKKSDNKIKENIDIPRKNYEISEFEFSEEEKQLANSKRQTCYSKHGYESEDLLKNNYNVFISHDKYIMPCCLISSFIGSCLQYSNGKEDNYQKEVLNKIMEIGIEKFSLKDKTLKEVFESGVLNEFVYDNLEKGISFGKCRLNCGIRMLCKNRKRRII